MRRPTGPAQRTSPQASAGEGQRENDARARQADEPKLSTAGSELAARGRRRMPGARAESQEAAARVERPAPAARATRVPADTPRTTSSERTDAFADAPTSRFGTWRTVRRAATERRRVERTEARRFTVRTRRRRQIQLACAAFAVLVIGGAIATAYSPVMALRHIDVVGAHSVKASQVQQALASELGKPLPLVHSSDVRHALDDFRLIESYSTQLEPPSTLVVRITERTPLAVVQAGSNYELVDRAGVVLAAASAPQPGYPVVRLKAGEQPSSSQGFAAAASVIASLSSAVRSTVTAASATSANDVTLTLSGGKTVVWGGTDRMELKTADLAALLKAAPSAHTYDVSSPEAPIAK